MEVAVSGASPECASPPQEQRGEKTLVAEDRYLRMEDVEAICGLKRSSIYEGQAQGWFPRAYRLSGTRVGWKLSDVMAWFNSRPRWDGSNK